MMSHLQGKIQYPKGVLVKLIRQLNDSANITSVLVSHDVKESLSIADHVCILAGGRVIAEGSAEEIRASEDPQVRQFLNGEPDGPVPFHYPEDNDVDDIGDNDGPISVASKSNKDGAVQ